MALSRETLARRVADAMRQAGVAQKDLAAAAEMDPTALSKALAGRRGFRAVELALIAEYLQVSVESLVAEEGALTQSRPLLAARKQCAQSPAVARALERAEQISEVDKLLGDLGRPGAEAEPPAPFRSADPVRQGEALARAVRMRVDPSADLPPDPDGLAAWAERALAVDVCITSLPPGLDGLAFSASRLRLALVSSGVVATRQRFTIAHEVCHLMCGDGAELTIDENLFARRSQEERRANAFAAALLMPADAIRDATEGTEIDEELIVGLLDRFRVSLDALAFRLHNVGVVDAAGRDRVRRMWSSPRVASRAKRLDDLQARHDQRIPGNLLARAMAAYTDGDIGIRPLAALLETDPEQLLEELNPPRFPTDEHDHPVYAL